MFKSKESKESKGAAQVSYVIITIQELKKKQIVEQKEKTDKDGIIEVRTHTKKESLTNTDVKYNWKTTEYRIPLFRLGLPTEASKEEILNVLNNPPRVANKTVQEILKKLEASYGGIKHNSKFGDKLHFKTEKFRKKRDYGPKKKVMMG
nr:hypothetical protein [Candidatus Sigynarchaeota archaeon]